MRDKCLMELPVRIDLLSFDGCPNVEATREVIEDALRLESVNAAIHFVRVETAEAARKMRFLGSPSVRVDGTDVEPSANARTAYGLMCRTYNDNAGAHARTPPIEMIRAAIRRRAGAEADFLGNPAMSMVLFYLPIVALAASSVLNHEPGLRAIIWTAALSVLGGSCVANALRCRRVHCYLTGPFFLMMAAVTALNGFGIAPFALIAWNTIVLTVSVGGVALCYLPELLMGRYRATLR